MKALKISLSHGRVWVAETSDGKRAQSSTLQGALNQLVPASSGGETFGALGRLFDGIRDSGSDGQIAQGRASA